MFYEINKIRACARTVRYKCQFIDSILGYKIHVPVHFKLVRGFIEIISIVKNLILPLITVRKTLASHTGLPYKLCLFSRFCDKDNSLKKINKDEVKFIFNYNRINSWASILVPLVIPCKFRDFQNKYQIKSSLPRITKNRKCSKNLIEKKYFGLHFISIGDVILFFCLKSSVI